MRSVVARSSRIAAQSMRAVARPDDLGRAAGLGLGLGLGLDLGRAAEHASRSPSVAAELSRALTPAALSLLVAFPPRIAAPLMG